MGVALDKAAPRAPRGQATRRPRVLLADDHTLLLDAFRKLLEPACEVVGAVGDGHALLAAVPELRPDVIVLDIAMPLLNGLDAAREIRKTLPSARLIFLTVSDDAELAAEAFRLGAAAYLLKSSAASELFHAIRTACAGRTYTTPLVRRVPAHGPTSRAAADPGRLTERQRVVLRLLAEGRSMKQVAAILELTPRTVAFHKYRMMRALGITTSAALIQFAVKHRLV